MTAPLHNGIIQTERGEHMFDSIDDGLAAIYEKLSDESASNAGDFIDIKLQLESIYNLLLAIQATVCGIYASGVNGDDGNIALA